MSIQPEVSPRILKGLHVLSNYLYLTPNERSEARQTSAYDAIQSHHITDASRVLSQRGFIINIYNIASSAEEFLSLLSRLNLLSCLHSGAIQAMIQADAFPSAKSKPKASTSTPASSSVGTVPTDSRSTQTLVRGLSTGTQSVPICTDSQVQTTDVGSSCASDLNAIVVGEQTQFVALPRCQVSIDGQFVTPTRCQTPIDITTHDTLPIAPDQTIFSSMVMDTSDDVLGQVSAFHSVVDLPPRRFLTAKRSSTLAPTGQSVVEQSSSPASHSAVDASARLPGPWILVPRRRRRPKKKKSNSTEGCSNGVLFHRNLQLLNAHGRGSNPVRRTVGDHRIHVKPSQTPMTYAQAAGFQPKMNAPGRVGLNQPITLPVKGSRHGMTSGELNAKDRRFQQLFDMFMVLSNY